VIALKPPNKSDDREKESPVPEIVPKALKPNIIIDL
jgi:hypothetical protein